MENKKLAAAMAAITAVISSQEQAAMEMQHTAETMNTPLSVPPVNLWGLSGRQAIMHANSFVQQRLYK